MKFLKLILFAGISLLYTYGYSSNEQELIDHVKLSIENATMGISKLTPAVLKLDGLSSSKVRHLLNNLCSLPNSRYLEIGVYRGSTFISALYQNQKTILDAIAIDNWSEFGFQKNIFLKNCTEFIKNEPFKFFEINSFEANVLEIFDNPITIYFYDGEHSVEAQKKAFTYYNTVFANTFIAVVDDWNWQQVRTGTQQAFKELGYKVLYEKELPASYVGDLENWWNGVYIAVIQKP